MNVSLLLRQYSTRLFWSLSALYSDDKNREKNVFFLYTIQFPFYLLIDFDCLRSGVLVAVVTLTHYACEAIMPRYLLKVIQICSIEWDGQTRKSIEMWRLMITNGILCCTCNQCHLFSIRFVNEMTWKIKFRLNRSRNGVNLFIAMKKKQL